MEVRGVFSSWVTLAVNSLRAFCRVSSTCATATAACSTGSAARPASLRASTKARIRPTAAEATKPKIPGSITALREEMGMAAGRYCRR